MSNDKLDNENDSVKQTIPTIVSSKKPRKSVRSSIASNF